MGAVNETQVLIVGAGPTGLVLALWLARLGLSPRVIDSRVGLGQESRALDVQARTLELYDQLGLAEEMVSGGVRVDLVHVRDRGRVVVAVDVRDAGRGLSPYPFILCYPQDDHEALLARELAAAGTEVEWETALVTMHDSGDRVSVVLTGPGGTLSDSTVGYVFGCDGAGSTVRQQMGVPFPGATSDRSYFVADVLATGEAAPPPSNQGLFSFCLSEADFLLLIPARTTGTHRIIGLVPAELTGREAVTFEDLRAVVERATATRVETVNWFSTYRVSHRMADRFRLGRAFLLGDAGHIHSPLGGQGMNTGIADAVNLGWKLAAVLQGRADPALLDSYEPERIAFARSLVSTTDRLFGLVAGSGLGHRLVRSLLLRRLLPALLHVPMTRRSLVTRISQVSVGYRTSMLSQGAAGAVRGGDRLPWVEGVHNFAPLRALDWQVHVYGTAGAPLVAMTERLGLRLQEFPWSIEASASGLRRDALYLVRPDGYLALADARQSPERLQQVIRSFGWLPRGTG